MDLAAVNIGSRREPCWDEALWDKAEGGISVKQHHPVYCGIALKCDDMWEGADCMYFQVIRDGRVLRLYYRGSAGRMNIDGEQESHPNYWCYAESRDGKTFRKVPLGIVDIPGHPENNVFFPRSQDNVHVYLDKNPDCPDDERFKALVGTKDQTLEYWKSGDGLHFSFERVLVDDGAYDSMNVVFWDRHTGQYFLYYRGMHGSHAEDGKWKKHSDGIEYHNQGLIRDVRVRRSKDFVTWDEPDRLIFGEDQEDYELYTNQVQPYYRGDHIFLGNPTRYCDRWKDEASFSYLPDRDIRMKLIEKEGRTGTAMTDSILMTSRDGVRFRRTDEAFMTPEMEDGNNWYYGDCYSALGMAETENDRPGMPPEISIYVPRNYRSKDVELCRYTLRLDGFFSWNAAFRGGSVLTRPLIMEGEKLYLNFATSALGYVRVVMCDENGKALEGFDSGRLFGDSVRRPVDFAGDLRTLAGKPVRILFEMKDADLYSFRFETVARIAQQMGRWKRKGEE